MRPKFESRETVLKAIKRSIMARVAVPGTAGSRTAFMVFCLRCEKLFYLKDRELRPELRPRPTWLAHGRSRDRWRSRGRTYSTALPNRLDPNRWFRGRRRIRFPLRCRPLYQAHR